MSGPTFFVGLHEPAHAKLVDRCLARGERQLVCTVCGQSCWERDNRRVQ